MKKPSLFFLCLLFLSRPTFQFMSPIHLSSCFCFPPSIPYSLIYVLLALFPSKKNITWKDLYRICFCFLTFSLTLFSLILSGFFPPPSLLYCYSAWSKYYWKDLQLWCNPRQTVTWDLSPYISWLSHIGAFQGPSMLNWSQSRAHFLSGKRFLDQLWQSLFYHKCSILGGFKLGYFCVTVLWTGQIFNLLWCFFLVQI